MSTWGQKPKGLGKSRKNGNESVQSVGTSGTGKTLSYMAENLASEIGKKLVLCLFPKRSTGDQLLRIAYNITPNVLIDRLDVTDRVLTLRTLGVSDATCE